MDLPFGILVPMLLSLALISGVSSSQLYLQPSKPTHGYFTNDSFFITCFTTEESIDTLTWVDFDGNEITATEGRMHVQPADGIQQGLRLVVTSVEKQDAGTYTCSDVHNSVNFELIVYRSISFSDTPKVQQAHEGETAEVMCHVKSDPKAAVNWYLNGTKIVDTDKYRVMEHGLTIHDLVRGDAGEYKCKAFVITPLGAQIKELDITLHVEYSPELLPDQKTVSYATIGTVTNITCSVSADPAPMFQWIRDEETLHNSSDHMIFNSINRSVLQMTIEDQYQLGDYTCRASNTHGWKEVTIELREGNTPLAPQLSVANEDQGVVKLRIQPQTVKKPSEELKITGFRVEYILAAETWEAATIKEFNIGEQYQIKNVSHSSQYVFRAASRNAAGFGDYSNEVEYTTLSLEKASVVGFGTTNMIASSLAIFFPIVFGLMFQ